MMIKLELSLTALRLRFLFLDTMLYHSCILHLCMSLYVTLSEAYLKTNAEILTIPTVWLDYTLITYNFYMEIKFQFFFQNSKVLSNSGTSVVGDRKHHISLFLVQLGMACIYLPDRSVILGGRVYGRASFTHLHQLMGPPRQSEKFEPL